MTASAYMQGTLELKWPATVVLYWLKMFQFLYVPSHQSLEMGHNGKTLTLDKVMWLSKGEAVLEADGNWRSHVLTRGTG